MDYILRGNDKDVTNVLKEQRIRINRGMIQLIPISECGLVTEEDARKTLECMLAEKNEEIGKRKKNKEREKKKKQKTQQQQKHQKKNKNYRMKAVLKYAIVVAAGLLLAGCGYKVNYSLSGASIPPDAKTFSVAYFPNNAPMVAPILSSTLTDALRDKFTRQTRLTQVDEGGDFAFEGEITGYTSTTASVSGSSETALLNRLTITVNVRFTNAVDESMSWKKTFSAFEDFDSSKLLNEIEGELIPQIVDKLVTDIFQASAANW